MRNNTSRRADTFDYGLERGGSTDRPTHRRAFRLACFLCLAVAGACDVPDPATPGASPTGPEAVATITTYGDVGSYDATVAIDWFRLSFDLTRDEAMTPPVAARAFGYAGVTLWESVAPGVSGGVSLGGQLNGLSGLPRPDHEMHWPTVANAALADILRRFHTAPLSVQAINRLEREYQHRFRAGVSGPVFGQSQAWGRRIASAIWQWSRADGHDQLDACTWSPQSGPGAWVPTAPGFESAVEPCWGSLRPFVLSSPGACPAAPHPAYSEDPASEFHGQAVEVHETVIHLTPEQAEIARYWADLPGETATPAGHSLSITAQVLESIGARLDLAAEAFARVGIGEADAFISCWATKYHYGLLRPVTYINRLIDPSWGPILETPPFPAYTSGHSNDAGASSTILAAVFGEPFGFTDRTHVGRGFAPRTFFSFGEAALESAFSRLYGGIHYRFDITEGLAQGQCVGRAVNALAFRISP